MKEYNITDILAQESIDNAIAYYGIEGTEEVIKRVYGNMPKIKNTLLDALWKRIKK